MRSSRALASRPCAGCRCSLQRRGTCLRAQPAARLPPCRLQGAAPRGGQASAAGPADAYVQTQPTTYMSRLGVADAEISPSGCAAAAAAAVPTLVCQQQGCGARAALLRVCGAALPLAAAHSGRSICRPPLTRRLCPLAPAGPPACRQLDADAQGQKYAKRQGSLQRTMKRVFPGLFQGQLPLTTKCAAGGPAWEGRGTCRGGCWRLQLWCWAICASH